MLYNSVEVEAVKLSVTSMEEVGLSRKEVLLKSISCLRDNYVMHRDKAYLYKAVWHIYAYMELGFSYSDGEEVFKEILGFLQIDTLILEQQKNCKTIKLNKTNIRNLLGRWNPVLHSMKIEEVVNSIICHVRNRQEGDYVYHCGKVVEETEDRTLWEHTFKLHVEKTQTFLHYINKNQYYFFEEK